jgi:hypothetical protein
MWAGEEARRLFAGAAEEIAPLTAEVCDSFLAGLYFLLTVHELFTADPTPVVELAAHVTDIQPEEGICKLKDDASLRNLARARAALGVNPYLAAAVIRETRRTLSAGHPGLFADIEPAFLGRPAGS